MLRAWMQARLMDCQDRAWKEVSVLADLGVDCGRYKWHQNQSHVEAHFLIPKNLSSKQVMP